ncbi:uncharacterized protein LOC141904501 [Tubulanus polymorphus]|uniref:uncharacterized protein LOC141904501 n=1 Tax=Tubulanus polymorphus TaxID=672921 RepID=UPI003DA455F1
MPLDLYMMPPSPPCRAVMMLGKAAKIDMNWKVVDMMKQEHMKPEFLKMNPQHTIPTLDDNGFYLWESRSILTYLADKYGNDSLYPKDLQARAHVNRFLYFDMEKISGKLGPFIYPQLFKGEKPSTELEKEMKDGFDVLEEFLKGKKYVAGDNLTIADFSIAASISFLEAIKYDISGWANIDAYMKRMKALPYWKECNDGIKMIHEMLKKMKENAVPLLYTICMQSLYALKGRCVLLPSHYSQMPIDLYMMPPSAPCRAVMMLGKEAKIDINWKVVDMMNKEQLKPEFIKMNPQHTIPTLDDNGFYLWESRSILMYLAEKYGDESLYPKDLQARAHVNRFLYFDMEKIYGKLGPFIYPQLFRGEKPSEELEKAMKDGFDVLEEYLKGNKYVTGDNLTIADFSIAASIAFLEAIKYDISGWANIDAYMKRMKALSYWNECNDGIKMIHEMLKKMKENAAK